MQQIAKVSGKYQTTIPMAVRKALGINAGDRVCFELAGDRGDVVTIRRFPTLDEIAGTVPVPAELEGLTWSEIRRRAWASTNAPRTRGPKGT
jgi:AbrB family looped-hinge helix DNA binding protein